jgi:flagellar capping protein FliD
MSLISSQCKSLPISVTASASTSTALPAKGNTIRIVNEGPNQAFISVGTGAQTATLPNATPTGTSTEVLAGSDVSFSLPSDSIQNISAICRASGTALLVVQVGEGE